MSKPNVSEGFRQKVKQFFGVKKGHVIPSSVHDGPKADEFFFHLDLLQEIGKESPLSSRVKVLKELCDFLAVRRVEDHAVEAAWAAVEDLLNPNSPMEARHVTLSFLTVMISGQFDRLGILRAHFFLVIVNHKISEDIDLRLEMLKALSDNGKDISYFEEMIGPFLLSWMPEILQSGRIAVFMPLLINIIHYNSSYLDEDVVSGVVRETCHLSRTTKHDEDVELCICLLDAVVRYSCLPSNAVFDFIATACRAVNIEKFCQHSWKIMRNLLGTHLGHSVVYTMCSVMEDSDNGSDVLLLRGSVFFIGMCLWGSQRVPNLKYSNSTVLPSMLQALSCRHTLVALEVTLSVQRLVKKYGHELHVVAWDAVLDIIEALQQQIENTPGDTNLIESFHILLTSIEDLHEAGKFNGPEERFFGLVEKSASMRPERSLHILVSFKAQTVHPAHVGWLSNLQTLMEKYFRYEIRTSVRVKVLDVLSSILTSFGHWYEDELLDTVVLPYLNRVSEDQDVTVRNVSVQILLDLTQMCDSSKCQDFLNIIEKVLSRHVELHGKMSPMEQVDQQLLQEERELKDVKTAVNGLVEVFKAKLFRLPHGHAERTFQLLVFHVKAHYCHRYSTYIASVIRNLAFECFLSLRCDSHLRLGIVDTSEEESRGKFSPYFLCVHSDPSDIRTGSSSHLGVIAYSEVFDVILSCLQYEWDWTVLEYVLTKLPEVLQNKSLILSANPDLNKMTSVLCHMVSDASCIIELCRVPRGVGRTGLQALVFPVLTVLATYHSCLDRGRQFELVKALELGLVSRCAVLCVSSLTLCTMEMQAVMKSLLPALLVRLSQISATVSMAAPMLEFLSGLVHLPHLYASFQDSQYKSVFAICLPYTDPFKYSHYTVTLAYHVIAAWFIRSRVAYRKGFVGFVSKGLKSSAVLPDHYESRPESPALAGPRSRSSSSTTQPPPQIIIHRSNSPVNPLLYKETDAACEFHAEMTDVCIDMMARYTFAPCMSQPNRTKAVEFMLASGHRRSWMIGNTIVTITTSGTYIGQDGVCENCLALRTRTIDLIDDERSQINATAKQKSSVEGGKGERQEKEDRSFTSGLRSDLAGSHHEKPLIAPASSQVMSAGERSSSRNVSHKDTKFEPMNGTSASSAMTMNKVPPHQSTDKFNSSDIAKTMDTRRSSLPEHRFRDSSPVRVQNCQCVCQGWAEILTRRPSGNISWIMRIQNRPAPVCLDNDVCTAVVDDPQIGDFLSPHAEKQGEVLSTSTESGSVLVDVVRQTNAPVGICENKSNVTGLEEAPSDWQLDSTEENQVAEPRELDHVLMYSPSNSSSTPPSTPTWSVDSDTFEGRGRLLSRSPRRGPSVFRMRDSEMSGQLGSVESTTTEEEPTYDTRKQLHFEKPELGVSPAEVSPSPPSGARIQPSHGEREKTRYLSSSEMYRLASDEESVQSLNIDEGEDQTVLDGKNMEQLEQDSARHEASSEALTVSRPKSLEFNSLTPGNQVIRESPELQLERTFHDRNMNTATATNLNEGVGKDVEDSKRTAHPHTHAQSLDTSSQPSKKVKLKKAATISAPVRTKKGLYHSNSSPFRSPRQAHSSVMLRSREAEDRLGFSGAVRDPKKSTSSPELSSPPPFPKVPTLSKADTTKRLLSRSRHAPGSHPANKATKSGQVTGDPTDVGPKEPPILVTPSESFRYPLDPCFVFLQLHHASFLGPGHEKPQPLPDDEVIERAIKCLDRIPPYDTHKIGVIYVGPGQHDNEAAILRNVYGSSRYMKFLAGLGTLVRLRDCPPAEIYTGGLDRNGADGEFAYSWQDDIYQVIFHVATLMPTKDSDPGCNSKKMHIGNDFVTIVYNDSQQTVKFGRIKGQFNFAEVLIKPLDNESNIVTLRFKDELKDLLTDTGARVISDSNLPRLVRQLVVHINMASVIHQSQKKPTDAYGCNWLERLRQIKRVRSKAATESFTSTTCNPASKTYPAIVLRPSPALGPSLTDFTEYVMR